MQHLVFRYRKAAAAGAAQASTISSAMDRPDSQLSPPVDTETSPASAAAHQNSGASLAGDAQSGQSKTVAGK